MKARISLTIGSIVLTLILAAWTAASPADALLASEIAASQSGDFEAPQYSIGDYLWFDGDGDGIQDEDEVGIAGVEVALFTSKGEHVASAISNADGRYEFNKLTPGEYFLVFDTPEAMSFTHMDQGDDESSDSDVNPVSGESNVFVVGDEDNNNLDAGYLEGSEFEALGLSSTGDQVCYGPDPDDFPDGVSPLTGLTVEAPESLKLRPVFVSISLFPPSVRPPTGLSDSPVVYQFTIGDGDTRLLAAFHGDYPGVEFDPIEGGEHVVVPEDADYVVGDRVWFDMNGNSVQDSHEPGVPGVPVKLYVNGSGFAETLTDGNGHYYFDYSDAEGATTIQLEFDIPAQYAEYYFVGKGAGNDDNLDSDVFVEGFSEVYDVDDEISAMNFDVDAGLRQSVRIEGVRSGRVFYEDIRVQFSGCVVTAGADPAVAAQIQTCGFAASNDEGNIGASGLDITQLSNIAAQNSNSTAPNLTGNVYCSSVPGGGQEANELYTYWNVNNRDHFVYDEGAGAYAWSKNLPSNNEQFVVLSDRLNGETLFYENVVVMLINHTQMNSDGTIFEMDLGTTTGKAYILRNGMVYQATWSTINGEYEQESGMLRPFRFLDSEGNPFPFAPGQTWVNMLNSYHSFEEIDDGVWKARFYAPAYGN